MYVYTCAPEAAAPTVFMGLATGLVLMVAFLLRYSPFSLYFECFPKFITCVHKIRYFLFYNLYFESSHFLHKNSFLHSCCAWTTEQCNLPTFVIRLFPAINNGCGTHSEELKDRTQTCGNVR